jgi:hypothetical protein
MELEIKWIIDIPALEHTGVGCEFQNISGMMREKIGQFIDNVLSIDTGLRKLAAYN